MANNNLPRKRAGDTEREHVASVLRDAHADGQLTLAEFDERIAATYAAAFSDELPALISDLTPVPQDTARASLPVSTRPGGSSFSFSVMGGVEKKGDWHIAPTHTSITVMGGNELDLRHVTLSSQETVINAFAVMGGIDIIVPDDVRVVDDGIGLMGGFGIEDDPACTVIQCELPDDAPVIRIRGIALMGGVGIIRAPREG